MHADQLLDASRAAPRGAAARRTGRAACSSSSIALSRAGCSGWSSPMRCSAAMGMRDECDGHRALRLRSPAMIPQTRRLAFAESCLRSAGTLSHDRETHRGRAAPRVGGPGRRERHARIARRSPAPEPARRRISRARLLRQPAPRIIGGEPSYPTCARLPQAVDLAVIVTPAVPCPRPCSTTAASAACAAPSSCPRDFAKAARQARPASARCCRRAPVRPALARPEQPRRDPNRHRPQCRLRRRAPRRQAGSRSCRSRARCARRSLDWARSRHVGFSTVISTGVGDDIDFGESSISSRAMRRPTASCSTWRASATRAAS